RPAASDYSGDEGPPLERAALPKPGRGAWVRGAELKMPFLAPPLPVLPPGQSGAVFRFHRRPGTRDRLLGPAAVTGTILFQRLSPRRRPRALPGGPRSPSRPGPGVRQAPRIRAAAASPP